MGFEVACIQEKHVDNLKIKGGHRTRSCLSTASLVFALQSNRKYWEPFYMCEQNIVQCKSSFWNGDCQSVKTIAGRRNRKQIQKCPSNEKREKLLLRYEKIFLRRRRRSVKKVEQTKQRCTLFSLTLRETSKVTFPRFLSNRTTLWQLWRSDLQKETSSMSLAFVQTPQRAKAPPNQASIQKASYGIFCGKHLPLAVKL